MCGLASVSLYVQVLALEMGQLLAWGVSFRETFRHFLSFAPLVPR